MTQPQTEMVEKMARAIAASFERGSPDLAKDMRMDWQTWADEARAALASIAPDIEELVGALREAAETTDDQRTARELFAALSKFTNTKGNDRGA